MMGLFDVFKKAGSVNEITQTKKDAMIMVSAIVGILSLCGWIVVALSTRSSPPPTILQSIVRLGRIAGGALMAINTTLKSSDWGGFIGSVMMLHFFVTFPVITITACVFNTVAWLKNSRKSLLVSGILYVVALNPILAILCFVRYRKTKKTENRGVNDGVV
jgi:hypothetical protein